ncbi:NAD(P)/FAD-dependent oxidoreductase [Salinarimonas ramus]|uniref:Cytochrome c4 n=1 Tax=Salinarimonas ramus TaxID=690164 RepID=A0A917V293_9HYPH|nr:FAD-dependent oxidoreductase [Salinarimonas ramus]GGK20666.1 cytochrome c4 [Salinarimonas ramus]
MDADVVVVGSGMVGVGVAVALAERGLDVAVVDPGDPRARASFGNAGVLGRGSIFPLASPGVLRKLPAYALGRDPSVRVRLRALPSCARWLAGFVRAANERRWRRSAAALAPFVALAPSMHEALAARSGAGQMISRSGYLRLYRDASAPAAAKTERAVLAEHGIAAEALDAADLRALEPHLSPLFVAGLLFPQSASVDTPGALLASYAAHAEGIGVRFVASVARAVRQEEDGVVVEIEGGRLRAGRAVIAAGVRSGPFAAALGCAVPLVAERGYHRTLSLAGNAVLGRPAHDAAGGYVMSPMDGGVRIHSGVELARPDDPPNHDQIDLATAEARRSLPLAGEAGETWMGSRPSTPDGLPVIGFAPRAHRVVLAFGHGHIGFATGPLTGRLVAELLAGETPSVPLAPFAPDRFRSWRGAG